MSALAEFEATLGVWEPPPTKPLDEGVWQAWLAKGVALDRQSSDARAGFAKWVSIAALLAAAGLWSQITPYQMLVSCIVAAGAIVLMVQSFHLRQYAFAVVFGALALLFNPAAAAFSFSGNWERAVVVASAVPFVTSLAYENVRLAHHG